MNSEPFSLYVHIPYCVKKCPYCDFNSYAVGQEFSDPQTEKSYVQALLQELKQYQLLPDWSGRKCGTVFFGGGTPSLFEPASIGAVLKLCDSLFGFENPEITLEANPGTIGEQLGEAKLSGFRSAGVNRISIGVQSFRAEKLAYLGRIHSAADVTAAVKNIRAAGFSNFNLDLIFGAGGETLEQWSDDLEKAISFEPAHLSAYGLTIEPGTEFARLDKLGKLPRADEDAQAEMYELTQALTERNGLQQYEISNYSRERLECRHNLTYWSGGDYLGLGAGAHSFRRAARTEADHFGRRWSNTPGPRQYVEAIAQRGEARQREELVDRQKAKLEFFFLGLRTKEGAQLTDYPAKFQEPFPERARAAVVRFETQGLLRVEDERVSLTKRGYLFADGIVSELSAAL